MNMKITPKVLESIDACEDGKSFFVRNNLIGLNIDKIDLIDGDFCCYVEWLKSNIAGCAFDKNGNIIKDNLTTFEYDELDRVVKITKDAYTLYSKSVETISYNNNTIVKEKLYVNGDKNNEIIVKNDNGQTIFVFYCEIKNGVVTTSRRNDYTYDQYGNNIKSVCDGGTSRESVLEYIYDGKNCLKEIQDGDVYCEYRYNQDGYHIRTDYGGSSNVYTRDEQNRMLTKSNQDGLVIDSYTYDGDTCTRVTYDGDEKFKTTVYKCVGDDKITISEYYASGGGFTCDDQGRLITHTNRDGFVLRNEYDEIGNVTMLHNLKLRYRFVDGRLYTITNQYGNVLLKIPSECFV